MAIPAKRALGWSASATALCLAGCATPPQAPTTAVTPTDQLTATRSTQTVPLPMRVDAVFPVRDGDRTLVRAATFHPTTNILGRNKIENYVVASLTPSKDHWMGRMSFNFESDKTNGDRHVVNGTATLMNVANTTNLTIHGMRYDASFAPPALGSGIGAILHNQRGAESVQLRDLHSTRALTDAEKRAVEAGTAAEEFLNTALLAVQKQKASLDNSPQTPSTVKIAGSICDYRQSGAWNANLMTAYGLARVHVTPTTSEVYTNNQSAILVGKFNSPISFKANIPLIGQVTSSPVISAVVIGGGVRVTEDQNGQRIERESVTSRKLWGASNLDFKTQDDVTKWARSWQEIALFAANQANTEGCFNNGLGPINKTATPSRSNQSRAGTGATPAP